MRTSSLPSLLTSAIATPSERNFPSIVVFFQEIGEATSAARRRGAEQDDDRQPQRPLDPDSLIHLALSPSVVPRCGACPCGGGRPHEVTAAGQPEPPCRRFFAGKVYKQTRERRTSPCLGFVDVSPWRVRVEFSDCHYITVFSPAGGAGGFSSVKLQCLQDPSRVRAASAHTATLCLTLQSQGHQA